MTFSETPCSSFFFNDASIDVRLVGGQFLLFFRVVTAFILSNHSATLFSNTGFLNRLLIVQRSFRADTVPLEEFLQKLLT